MQSKPEVILVHGGGQGPWVFDRLSPILHAAGLVVHAPTLPTTGQESPVCLQDDIDTVYSRLEKTLGGGKQAILLGHSFGATVAGAALEHLSPEQKGRIKGLIMVAGLPLAKGMSLDDLGSAPYMIKESGRRSFDPSQLPSLMYSDMADDPDMKSFAGKNNFSSSDMYSDRTPYSPYNKEGADVPITYVMNTADKVCDPQYQEMFVSQMPPSIKVVKLDAGHMAPLSRSEEIGKVVVALSQES